MLENLNEEQFRLEAEMSDRGIRRFLEKAAEERKKGEATRTKSMQLILDVAMIPVQQGIEDFLNEVDNSKAGRRHSAAAALRGLETMEVAFITVKSILNCLTTSMTLTALAVRLGRELEFEQRLRKFSKTNPAAFIEARDVLNTQTTNLNHRSRVYQAVLKQNPDDWTGWTEGEHCRVGLKLVEIFIEKTGLIERYTFRKQKKTFSHVKASDRFLAWLDQLDRSGSLLLPEYYPTVITPKRWDGIKGGGYFTESVEPLKLIKIRSKRHREVIENADLSKVIEAVNTLQETAWAINKRILDVATDLQTYKFACAGLPAWEQIEKPPVPIDMDTNEVARRAWKRQATKIHVLNRAETSKRLQTLRIFEIARKFKDYERIYFPYQTDFRGRVYAVPQTLNPQGNDLSKALLHFAEGDLIDSREAESWFFIHGSNCYGNDKVNFEDRKQWVLDNHDDILRTASEPLDFHWWMKADKPFCFLAWCFEYAEYKKDANFKSRIPIAMDGSCNGLQHYSAMLQDPVGAKATNLSTSDKPQDIYQDVANEVIKILKHLVITGETEEDREFARGWLTFPIDRKITKRSVMVLPYGGTQQSCQSYVIEAVKEKIADGVAFPFEEERLFRACGWLGGRVWLAMGKVVIGARAAMEWLKKVARTLAHKKIPIQWTAPSGFTIYQAYPEIRKYRIYTILMGERFDPRMTAEVEGTIDKRRQQNGIAPNFVHSYDAAALILTVLKAKDAGITKFAMIHDSYATTAKHTAILAKCLRSVFVKIYESNDTLLNFMKDTVPENMKSNLNLPPNVGGFSVSEVRNSPYFFA